MSVNIAVTVNELINKIQDRPRSVTLEKLAIRTKLNKYWLIRFLKGECPDPRLSQYLALKDFADSL